MSTEPAADPDAALSAATRLHMCDADHHL